MIKRFPILLLILMSATWAFSQTKSSEAIAAQLKTLKADKIFSLNYDKNSDTSKILGFSEDFGKEQNKRNAVSSLRFGLAFFFLGKELKSAPTEYTLTFQAGTKRAKFADAHSLTFTIDDQVLNLGEARYANKNQGIEYLNFKLSREQLAKLAKGKTARMKIGNAEYTLTAAHLKMFADFYALSDPATI
jgi:hypothetical protein